MDMRSCIDACMACQEACTLCAEDCRNHGNVANAELAEACSKQCEVAISAMRKNSSRECGTCSQLCAECAEMCASMEGEIHARCAEACARCADECGKMVLADGGQAMLF